jgi:hypothetical protein
VSTARCTKCGVTEHVNLLDGKSPDGDEGSDFTLLECIACYGEGWCPTGGPEDFKKSVAPSLSHLYGRWRET